MHFEITDLRFDLDELDKNPDKKTQTERELFERFAAPSGDHKLVFEGMNRKESRYRTKFVAKPGTSLEQVHAWLLNQGFHRFYVEQVFE